MSAWVLVCGVGQALRGDDAVGLVAVRRWQRAYPDLAMHPAVQVLTLESPGLRLLAPLGRVRAALLVDAVASGAAPGTVHHLTPERLAAFAPGGASAHGWGVAESLALARRLGAPLPEELHILGVEMSGLDLGAGLSPQVRRALPGVLAAMTAWVEQQLARGKEEVAHA